LVEGAVWLLSGVIWDFDGTIVDTETPQFDAWQAVFRGFGARLDSVNWGRMVGTIDGVDPIDVLEQQIGPVDHGTIHQAFLERSAALLQDAALRPGVKPLLDDLLRRMVLCAIASSSSRPWIQKYLLEHNISRYFSAIASATDVDHPKPDPAVYHLALALLRLNPDEVIAIEDSPYGATAALEAGITCVVVTNPSTAELHFPREIIQLPTLQGVTVAQLQEMLGSSRKTPPPPY